jgi:N-acetylmuramic acid 6-phosphate (MurNAc-6-P) etherase
LTGCGEDEARAALRDAGGKVKLAALMVLRGMERGAAEAALGRSGGNLRGALQG